MGARRLWPGAVQPRDNCIHAQGGHTAAAVVAVAVSRRRSPLRFNGHHTRRIQHCSRSQGDRPHVSHAI